MSRRKLITVLLAGSASLLSSAAFAQTVYNPDGTKSMLGPNPAGVDAGTSAAGGATAAPVFDDARAPGTGAVAPSAAAAAQNEERYDIDCDPDIDVCVDPNAQPIFDDGYDPNAYQQFESTLAPYGSWTEDATYGRVWTPSQEYVGSDFMPYATGGEWVPTSDYGYAWSSDYDWGWAPFHYGRWLFLAGCGGWSWIPGTIWGPAWVDWRYGGGYVGWAPLAPHGVLIGPPSSLGTRTPWRFVVASEFTHRNPLMVPSHVVPTVFARTAPVRNLRTMTMGGVTTHITLGPPISTVSRDLGRSIPALALKSTAPSVLPRQHIMARPGVGLDQRPYLHGSGAGVRVPNTYGAQPGRSAQPQYHPGVLPRQPGVAAPPVYRYGTPSAPPAYHYNSTPPPVYRGPTQTYSPPVYSPPVYRGPTQTYSPPVYRGPTQTYSPPAYRGPTQTYSPPAYRGPTQTYSPPVYRGPTPSYSPPSYHAPTMSAPPASRPSAPAPARSVTPSFGGSTRRH